MQYGVEMFENLGSRPLTVVEEGSSRDNGVFNKKQPLVGLEFT